MLNQFYLLFLFFDKIKLYCYPQRAIIDENNYTVVIAMEE